MTHLVPGDTSQRNTNSPELRVHQVDFEKLDQNGLVVIPLPVYLVPLVIPILQIGEYAFHERDGLRVDFTVKRTEMLDDSYADIDQFD